MATKVGVELLRDPALNKSTAFSEADKEELGLVGRSSTAPSCQDPARSLPIVYDPTIGEACLRAGVHDTARSGRRRRLARTV